MKNLAVGLLVALLTSGAYTKESRTQTRRESAKSCDRACLEGFVDQYLNAALPRDPALS